MNRYFYIDAEGNQKGTFTALELKQESVKRDTLVWTQGMEQWKRAEEVDELRYLFSGTYQEAPSYTDQPAHPVQFPGGQAIFAPGIDEKERRPMPKTWLVESILVTILPFMLCGSFLSLLGIIGIVYAAQVESFYNRGDYVAATESSRSAGKWTRIAMWIAIGWVLLFVIGMILLFGIIGWAGFSEMGNMIEM